MKDIATNPVRVSLPASVASDIDRLKKAVGSVLGHLGCQACCSGHDIFFELQREFIFDKDLRETSVAMAGRRGGAAGKTANIGLNPDAASNIDNVFIAIDKLADLTGHTSCATGCDILFGLERMLVLDARLNVRERVMTIG